MVRRPTEVLALVKAANRENLDLTGLAEGQLAELLKQPPRQRRSAMLAMIDEEKTHEAAAPMA
jgi:hypothetical protein